MINYETTDITKKTNHYDLILGVVGNHSISTFKHMLNPEGRFIAAAGSVMRVLWLAIPRRKKMKSMLCQPNPKDLKFLSTLLGGNSLAPVLDKSFSFENVQDAIAYMEAGRARGKVALRTLGE